MKESMSTDISAARVTEVNNLHKRFVRIMKKGAFAAFEIGKILRDIWDRIDAHESWPGWCKDNLTFDVRTANTYLRIYENFKDNPKLLSGHTITGALKLLSAPQNEKQEAKEESLKEKYETPWEQYFEAPPLSRKVKLNNHRFEIPNSRELYLIRRGFNYPVRIAEVLAPGSDDSRLKSAYRGMMENVQVALEMYFQEIERIESLQEKKK